MAIEDPLVTGISVSENTSPFMEERSEQVGEWNQDLGRTIGPRDWQVLGGIGGRRRELEGVEVIGDREGVRAITEARS